MPYQLTLHQQPQYLHAIATGTNSEAAVRGYLADLLRECIARHCSRVLIEERLDGPRLPTLSVFLIASEQTERARGHLSAIAYVDINAKGDLMRFAEDVAVNRGLRAAVFASVDEARAWLLSTL